LTDELIDHVFDDGSLSDHKTSSLVDQRPLGHLLPVQIGNVVVRDHQVGA